MVLKELFDRFKSDGWKAHRILAKTNGALSKKVLAEWDQRLDSSGTRTPPVSTKQFQNIQERASYLNKWKNDNLREMYFYTLKKDGYFYQIRFHEPYQNNLSHLDYDTYKNWCFIITRKKDISRGTINSTLEDFNDVIDSLHFSKPNQSITFTKHDSSQVTIKKSDIKTILKSYLQNIETRFNSSSSQIVINNDGSSERKTLTFAECVEDDNQIYLSQKSFTGFPGYIKSLESIVKALKTSRENVQDLENITQRLQQLSEDCILYYGTNSQELASSRPSDWVKDVGRPETHHLLFKDHAHEMQRMDAPNNKTFERRNNFEIMITGRRGFLNPSPLTYTPTLHKKYTMNMTDIDYYRSIVGEILDGKSLDKSDIRFSGVLKNRISQSLINGTLTLDDFGSHTTNLVLDYLRQKNHLVYKRVSRKKSTTQRARVSKKESLLAMLDER